MDSGYTTEEKQFEAQWNFNLWECSEEEVFDTLWSLLCSLRLPQQFGLQERRFASFLTTLRQNRMRVNPYHNFLHSVDVAYSCYVLITPIQGIFTNLELFALLISGLLHDLDHPGVTNAFQIATQSAIAQQYQNVSVLEQHHLSQAKLLLSDENTNVLEGMAPESRQQMLLILEQCILATDIARHKYFLTKWQECSQIFDPSNFEHCLLLLQIVIKCADISNPTKEFELASKCSSMIREEFFLQGDLEKALGLSVSKFMDRHSTLDNDGTWQESFFKEFVMPLFTTMCNFLQVGTPIRQLEEIYPNGSLRDPTLRGIKFTYCS